jgi:RNA polymerase sigma-70 factor (ECF subfamily)
MPEPLPVRIEDLLAHSGWIRGLAAALVRDPAVADDLVQETWVAAMEHPPESGRPLRPWLAAVLRNFRRGEFREAGRRERRERAAARPERSSLPSAEELTSRLETARLLAGFVAALEEPYRSTVLLRFFEGMSSVEIARREGTPEGTVRWRLKRGLDTLRERLDLESGGDRSMWTAWVMPLLHTAPVRPAPGPGAAGPAVTTGGVLAMGTGMKAGIAFAVVLLAAGLLWKRMAEPGPGEAVAPPAGTAGVGASSTPGHGGKVALHPPLAGEPPPPVAVNREVSELVTKKGTVPSRVTGRVVEEHGQALPGAQIAIGLGAFGNAGVTTRAGVDGRFRCDLALPRLGFDDTPGRKGTFDASLVVSAAGRESLNRNLRLEAEGDLALGDIVLGPGGVIAGRVLDVAGAPVPGAWVGREDPARASGPVEERRLLGPEALLRGLPVTTDATGAFSLEGVGVGTVRLWAGMKGYRSGRSSPVEVTAGAESRTDLRIETEKPEDWVVGRVRSPDGSPVLQAMFSAQSEAPGRKNTQRVESGPEGTFRIPADYPGTFYLLAEDPYRKWGAALTGPLHAGDRDVEFRFPEPRKVALTVRSRAGEPVTSWNAQLTPGAVSFYLSIWGVRPGDHPGGRAEFLAPGFPFKVEVRAEGFANATLGPFDPLSGPESIDCTLDPVAAVKGRVLGKGGALAGARVLAQEIIPPGDKCIHDGLPLRWYSLEFSGVEGRSGKSGEFSLPLRKAGKYVVRVETEGYAPAEVGPVDFDPASGVAGVEVRLGLGGNLEGRVLVPPGRSPDGTIVVVHRGDAYPRSVRVGADGTYLFERLMPGPWILQQHDHLVPADTGSSYGPGTSEFRWNCTIEEGRTVTKDLDLTGSDVAVLRGHVSLGSAAGAAGWTAGLQPPKDEIPTTIPGAVVPSIPGAVTIGADGAFRLAAAAPGPWRVVLTSPDGALCIFDTVDLREGETSWTMDLALGRVEGTVEASLGAWSCVWEGEGGRWALGEVSPGKDGRFSLPRMPAGHTRLVVHDYGDRSAGSDPRRWPARREFDVPAGGTVRVE